MRSAWIAALVMTALAGASQVVADEVKSTPAAKTLPTDTASATSLSIPTATSSERTIDAPEAWRPLNAYVGTWKGTRTGDAGPIKLTRIYAAASANRRLEITEAGPDSPRAEVRGIVSFDRKRHALVMRQFELDGSASDLVLDPAQSTNGRVVFESLGSETPLTRVTYERTGPKRFIERIEHANGDAFALVSETRFVRKD